MPGIVIFAIIIGVVLVVLVLLGISIYNRLVTLKNRFQNGFSQIEVQLKRRHDLIPNLVETAKAYMGHERETLEAVVTARNQAAGVLQAASKSAGNLDAMGNLAGAENVLSGAMSKLFAVMESYPDLKANQNMMQLTEELTTTENKVAFARQAYNDQATAYNTYRQTFPPIVFASLFGHSANAALLDFDDADLESAPKVSFG